MKVENQFSKYKGWIDMDHMQVTAEQGTECGHVLNRALVCYKNDKSKIGT